MTDIVGRVRAFDAVRGCFLVLYVPQPFIRGDQAFFGAALPTIRRRPWAPHHELQHVQQAPGLRGSAALRETLSAH